jgi:chemotaxis protein histidine kinase CheA
MAAHFKTVLPGATDSDKLHALCKLTYKEQGVWFLNAFWEAGLPGGKGIGSNAEDIWNYVDKASVIDNAKKEGCAMDEMEAHRFLETFGEAHTVLQMRSQLRKTGALAENERPKEVPLTHYLLFKYEVDWHRLVNAAQGDNSAQIAEAQDKLQAVQDAFDASTKADAEATAALKEAVARESAAKASEAEAVARENEAKATEAEAKAREADAVARENEAKAREADAVARENEAKAREADAVATENEAKAREADAKEAEAPFKAAQEEVENALREVKAQEDGYNKKTQELKAASEEGGVVSRNKAKVQLDAHLAEDPLPLRKAKITLEAANKKAEKARAPFMAATQVASDAREKAEAARQQAESARKQAESARQQAEAARKQAESARQQAEAARQQAEAARKQAEAAREEAVRARKQAEAARAAAEEAKARAEAAVEAAQNAVKEAEAYLHELLANPGSGHGALWWIERELTEKKKYMPVSKGGIR